MANPGPTWMESAAAAGMSPSELGIAMYAKILCSAIFVSRRQPEEAARNSAYFVIPQRDRGNVEYSIDRDNGAVRVASDSGSARIARFYGDQGCVILPRGQDGVLFDPVEVKTTLPEAMSLPWPMGDAPADVTPLNGIDERLLEKAVATVFADPADLTTALVVVHKGRIVAERYAHGIDKDTQLESWSMGKSLTATLLGLLVRDGELALEDPAPVPAWRTPADPRGSIRIADLMRMSSGLRFTSPQDPGYDPASGYPDHLYVYSGAIDAFEFSYSRPLEFPPNSKGRYRNCDPLILGYIIKQIVTGRGEDYLSYPQRALFDRIGIRKQVLETDPYGNFLLTGHDYGTARNWARLGQLYLQDGVWQGQRLLPEPWVEFVRSPAPAWDELVYGGLFWLNGNGKYRLPRDAYFMSGAGGQLTFIIPSLDSVIVRMGYMRGDTPGMRNNLNAALELITRALRSVSTQS